MVVNLLYFYINIIYIPNIEMNNILTFEDFKRMNIRQVESVIYHQFIEDVIKDDIGLNEGFVRNYINKSASKFIKNALADEIEKGKELERNIKEALDGLNKGFNEIENEIKNRTKNPKLEAIEKVKEAIKAVQSQAFDTLTMIGSEGEIDFAGFMGSSTIAAAANFGILFSPIRSLFITRKAYKYFLGIIKQTIRRNLLIIQLNFDQFENLILQKSFQTNDDSEFTTKIVTLNRVMDLLIEQLCGKDSAYKFIIGRKNKDMKEYLENFRKAQDMLFKSNRESAKNNPYASLWQDQYNNTYTRTLEQIKQYINDDSQKELDALKNSITKMAGNDAELSSYGELLISAAEEYAIHTNHGINNNFIKMSSVFNLENQKKLIDLIVNTQEEIKKEIEKNRNKINSRVKKKKLKEKIKQGEKIYIDKLKGKTYTYNEFEKEIGDDISYLRAYLQSDEGKNAYSDLITTNPLYKYYIGCDLVELNELFHSLRNLKVFKVSSILDLEDKIVSKDQSLYYLMAERSIRNAVKNRPPSSELYFGFEKVEKIVSSSDDTLEDNINTILNVNLFPQVDRNGRKKRYFLTFDGNGDDIFNTLHNIFKTEIFDTDKKYVDDISIENKESIMKIIYKNLKIGNNIISPFAGYLVRLEAHMLLEKKDPWTVIENNEIISDYFTDKMSNRNAFVEIAEEDFETINKFLERYEELLKNDFDIENENNEEENK